MEFTKPIEPRYVDPKDPGPVLDQNTLLPWQKAVSPETHDLVAKKIKDVEGMSSGLEGRSNAKRAADSIFAMGTGGKSSALSSRASRMFGLNKQATDIGLKNQNVNRQRRELQRLGTELTNIENIKRINAEGHLRYADQIADYNDRLTASKYQVLNSVISGAGSFYGGIAGGMVGGAAVPSAGSGGATGVEAGMKAGMGG